MDNLDIHVKLGHKTHDEDKQSKKPTTKTNKAKNTIQKTKEMNNMDHWYTCTLWTTQTIDTHVLYEQHRPLIHMYFMNNTDHWYTCTL
jgi:hypothetical protein